MTATIVALASGRVPSAIAVLRVSGPAAFVAASRLAGRVPAPRRASLCRLRDAAGAVLDEALVLTFPRPLSATGEDVVEFHLHGGTAVVAGVIDALLAIETVRLAEPGEFTRRAFDNGRLDLAQVEGLADLIEAQTAAQRSQALALAGGALGHVAEALRDRALLILADAEAVLDFAEDEADVAERLVERRAPTIDALIVDLDVLLADANRGERLRDGLTIAVVGAPNVGKSSLVNILSQRDAAIVTPIAGTTRDLIEVPIDLGGVAAVLVDTAGLRASDDPIEQEGIRRARNRAASGDLVLHIVDRLPVDALGTLVINKVDLGTLVPVGIFGVSALRGDGIAALRDWLVHWARDIVRPGEPAVIGQARHRAVFEAARACLADARDQSDAVLAAESLRLAVSAFGRIAGRVGVEDVLDRVFSRFCIGK